jgi:LEA14-like dessication related protein
MTVRKSAYPSWRLSVVLSLCLFGFGCATWREDDPGLEVSLANVQFGEATVFETTMRCRLRVENEGLEPVRLAGGVHRIVLNGIRIGKGMAREEVEIPRFGAVEQDVVVHVSNLSLATRLRSVIETGRAHYRLESRLYAMRGNRARTQRLAKDGILDFHDFAPGGRGQLAPP